MRPSRSEFHTIRGLRYHVRTWGDPAHPRFFCLHGYLDVSATFQFVVDALQRDWFVIAPDWRGYGLTEWCPQGYWLADYVADLDALLRIYSPDEPTRLVAHSIASHIALLYAAARPERVARVVTLEGFMLRDMGPDAAVSLLRAYLDEIADPPRLRALPGLAEGAAQVRRMNPRLDDEQTTYLAAQRLELLPSGEARPRADPLHKMTCPDPNRLDEMLACWRPVEAPVLLIHTAESTNRAPAVVRREIELQKQALARLETHVIEGAGHMVHLDEPARVAALIERFLLN